MNELAAMFDQMAEMERRLRMVEGGTRIGLGSLRSAWGTAAADPVVDGNYNSGPVGSTWTADDGTSGTGYPLLTLTDCPSRFMIIWSVRPINIATNAVSSYRSRGGEVTVAINGVDVPALPNARRAFGNLNTGSTDVTMTMLVVRKELPGTKTFQMRALWSNDFPAGTIQPRLTDVYMGVLPLAAA